MFHFLQNIPLAIVYNLGFMSILYFVYLLVKKMNVLSAAHLFIMATTFLFISTIQLLYSIFSAHIYLFNPNVLMQPMNPSKSWLVVFGALYCIGLVGYIIYLVFHWLQLNIIKSNADFSNTKHLINLLPAGFSHVKVGKHHTISSPLTFGWIDTIILLPFSIVSNLPETSIKFILLHEIAHIIRHDFIVQIFIELAHRILYFNPMSYILYREINLQRELACDEWVIRQTNNTIDYSKTLYQIAQYQNNYNHFSLHAIGESKELLIRIKKMNQLKVQSTQIFLMPLGFILTCLLFTGLTNTKQPVKAKKIVQNTIPLSPSQPNIIPATNSKVYAVKAKIKTSPVPTNLPTISKQLKINNDLANYNKMVQETADWIQAREQPIRWASQSTTTDSLAFERAEKLVIQSVLTSYQLKKAILNKELEEMQSEKEAMEYLKNSKEWKAVLQYEKWTSTFFNKHPQFLSKLDSLRSLY